MVIAAERFGTRLTDDRAEQEKRNQLLTELVTFAGMLSSGQLERLVERSVELYRENVR